MMRKKAAFAPKAMMMKSMQRSISPEDDLFGGYEAQLQIESKRKEALSRQGFEKLEATSEYMETHYYGETNVNNYGSLISINQFWADYARYLLNPEAERGPFLTQSFTKVAACVR